MRVGFDGWGAAFDTEVDCNKDFNSLKIFPVGHSARNGLNLQKPLGYKSVFLWEDYLKEQNCRALPDSFFTKLRGTPPLPERRKNSNNYCTEKPNMFCPNLNPHAPSWSGDNQSPDKRCGDVALERMTRAYLDLK